MTNSGLFRNLHLKVLFPVFLGTIMFLYIIIAYFGERNAVKKHSENYNQQQALQTLIAANGLQQSYNQINSENDALIKHIKTIVEIESKPEKTLVNIIRSIVDSHPEIAGITLYFGDERHTIRWFDDNQIARNISEEWREQYGKGITRARTKFVPPFYIRSDMQYYGIIVNDYTQIGSIQLITVVDIMPCIERFVVPMRTGHFGAGFILDGLGNVVFDHETEIIGRNVFDGMHDPYEQLMKIDRRLISESFGTGEYAFTVERDGAVTRKLIAWHSANYGDQRLVVAQATPFTEVNSDIEQLRLQLYILASIFIVSILAGTLIYIRYMTRKAQQDRIEFLKVVMDAIPDMFYFKDRERRFIGCNTAFAEFINHSPDEIIGKKFYDLFPDYLNAHYDDFETAVLKKGVAQHFEERNTDFHPDIKALDTILTPLFDDEGKVEGVVCVSRDITEKYLIEQRLKQSEERYNLTQHAAGIASWEWNIEKDTLRFSPEAKSLLSLSPDKLVMPFMDVRELILSDDLDLFYEAYERCCAGINDFQLDLRFILPGKDVQWFSIRGSRMRSESDKSDRYMGIVQDITIRKRNELELKQLARAIDHAGEIILITEPDGRLTYVNPAFEKITGYTKEEVLGKTLGFLKSGRHSRQFYREFLNTIQSGKVWRGTFVNKRQDGTHFEVECTISPIRDQKGQIVKNVGVLKDVTLEKELKQQLMHTQKMEAIGTLAGGIAHDFNNILSAVIGYGELAILDVPKDNPSYRGIQEIVKAGYRAKEVIQQILTFSRRSDSERKPVQMKTIVEEIRVMLKTTLPANIEMKIDMQTDGLVYGDPSRLHQILMNLCTNSYQAMKPDGGILTIRVSETDSEKLPTQFAHTLKAGEYVKLSVIDTGCGMTPEVMKRIFEPYFTTKGHRGGTGLGLSTVHGIIRDYHGAIDVQSKPGSGTVIDVYLPLLTRKELIKNRNKPEFSSGEVYRIMFIDDDPNITSMIKIGLTRIGHQIFTFTDPENALNFYRNDPWQFDLIVSDISMPKFSGLDLLLEVRNTRPEMPVILCTGHDSFSDLDTAYRTGADLIIMKPITWQILIQKINEVMQQKKNV